MTRQHTQSRGTWLVVTAALLIVFVSPCAGRRATTPLADAAVIRSPEEDTDCRFLARFEMSDGLSAGRLELAVLEFRVAVVCPHDVDGLALEAYPVTTPWQGETVGWIEGWDTAGGDVNRALHTSWTAAPGDSAVMRFDVTDMVAAWTSQETENHGILMMRAGGERARVGPMVSAGGPKLLPGLVVWYTPCHREQQR